MFGALLNKELFLLSCQKSNWSKFLVENLLEVCIRC